MTTGDLVVLTSCPAWGTDGARTTTSGLFTIGEFHPAEQGHTAAFDLIRFGFDYPDFTVDGDDLFEQVHPNEHAKRMAEENWAASQPDFTDLFALAISDAVERGRDNDLW